MPIWVMLLFFTPTGNIKLKFLKNDTYNGSMEILLFSCTTIDSNTLSWEINDFGIGAFHRPDGIEEVIFGNYLNYTYVASLRSVRQNLTEYSIDSTFLVLAPSGSSLQVHCTNNIQNTNISNMATPIYTMNYTPQIRGSVALKPVVINSTINNGDNFNTRVYICTSGTASGIQTLRSITNVSFSFNSNSKLGEKKSTNSRDHLMLQAISLGQHQQNLITVLYVNDSNNLGVSCTAGDDSVEYPTNFINAASDEGRLMDCHVELQPEN